MSIYYPPPEYGSEEWQREHDYDWRNHDWHEFYDEALPLCHMTQDGTCMAAGSEYCDWKCPIMDEMRRAAKVEDDEDETS